MAEYQLEVTEQRQAGQLRWLTLRAPELARSVRPGQYVLVRCAAPGSFDPLLRRALVVAAAEESLGQIGLLYEPFERGLAWLARAQAGEQIDVLGPFGKPFELGRQTRTLLLVGQGAGIAGMFLLAAEAAKRGCAVTLLVGAASHEQLPPPFLLPPDVEYESIIGDVLDLLQQDSPAASPETHRGKKRASAPVASVQSATISWADQVCAAVSLEQAARLRDLVRATKFRWERGFVSALIEGPLVCGVGACGVCAAELRHGRRLLCMEGPVIDLRDL